MFSPWLLGGRVLAPLDIVEEMYLPWRGDRSQPSVHNHAVSDAVTQYLPYRMMAARSLEEDGYVGWSPLEFGGTALNVNTMALSYDWATQLHRFFGFWTAWHLGFIGRFLVAGFGMMVFLRSRRCNARVATALSVAYMMNTEFVSWIYHQWAVASFCWMPWALWALYSAREKSLRHIALAAVFLGLALLGATLQHAAFLAIALGCVWAGWLFEERSKEEKHTPSRMRYTVIVMAAGLLAAGLVAFMLEPTVGGYLENLRAGHEREGFGYKSGLLQPIMTVLVWPLTIYPFVLGSVQTLDLTKAFLSNGVAYAFFGTLPAVLALVGLFSRRVPAAAKLLIAAGLIIPLTPLVGVLYQRVSLLWILGGCWAAAIWVSTATENELKNLARWCWRILLAVLLLWVAVSIALVVFGKPLEIFLVARAQEAAARGQFTIFPEWVQMRAIGLLHYLRVWNPWQFLGLGGLALSLWGLGRCRGKASWSGVAFAAGIAVQLSVFWWQWTTWSVERDIYGRPELVRILQKETGTSGRLAQSSGRPGEIPFPPNTLVPAGVAIAGGYESIHPDGMRSATGKPWDFPGTTCFLGRLDGERPAGWRQAWSDGEWVLMSNPGAAIGRVVLDSGAEESLQPSALQRKTFNTMEVFVPAGARRVEIFSNWNRGWRWRDEVAGVWVPASRGQTKGVELVFSAPRPEAEVVSLRFDPLPPEWVRVISGLSGMAILALALSGRKEEKANTQRLPMD